MSAVPVVSLKGIGKSYRLGEERVLALDGVDLNVERGDFLAIQGASGSGKTTLMNIIGCMDRPDTGTYRFGGQDVEVLDDDALAEMRNEHLGFVFQKYHLIPQYTVMQNVLLPLLVRGVPRDAAEELAVERIRQMRLENRIAHKPSELSGGQQQRVAIARALVTSPSLLLADEPTGALDSTTGREILALFRALNEGGHTIVMITHDPAVARCAERRCLLSDGVLLPQG